MNVYVEKARALGVDVENVSQMHSLIQAFQYCEARFTARRPGAFKSELEQRYGWSDAELANMRQNPLLPIATQIVGEVFMERISETELRQAVMKIYFDDTLLWLKNMSRIAKGVPSKPGGQAPYDKDQIAAFVALQSIGLGEGFTKMLFDVTDDSSEEKGYLAKQKELKAGPVIVIEGEVREKLAE